MTSGHHPSCASIQANLSAFLDEMLPEEDQERIAQHLSGCAVCQLERNLLRNLTDTIREMPQGEPSEVFRKHLLAQAESEAVFERMQTVQMQQDGAGTIFRQTVRSAQLPFRAPHAPDERALASAITYRISQVIHSGGSSTQISTTSYASQETTS